MKIRTRLLLVLVTLGLLVGLISLAAVTAFGEIGDAVARVVERDVQTLGRCARMVEALDTQDRGFLLVMAGRSEPGSEAIRGGDERFRTALEAARQGARGDDGAEEERQMIEAVAASHSRFRDAVERLRTASAATSGGTQPSGDRMADYIAVARPYFDEVRRAIGALESVANTRIEAAAEETRRTGWRRSAWVLAVGTLGLALAVLIARRLYRSIAGPLERVSSGIVAIGRGDLGRRVPYEGRDELGMIALAVNATAERLATLEAAREGQLRIAQRLAGSILDSLHHPAVVVDRNGRMIMASLEARNRLGEDPIGALRAGAGGLVSPGTIDARLQSVLGDRVSEAPQVEDDPLVIRPLTGPAGSVLGAILFLHGSGSGAAASLTGPTAS